MDNEKRNLELELPLIRVVELAIDSSRRTYGNSKYRGKLKIFGWRTLRGFLPCKSILANRHVIPDGGCPICHNGAEDIKHLVFTCDRAKAA
jgi:hypothetical protein